MAQAEKKQFIRSVNNVEKLIFVYSVHLVK